MTQVINGKKHIALQNILLATDFSTASEHALDVAVGIARRHDAKIFLAHVIRPDAFQLVPPEALVQTTEQTRRFAEQHMAELLVTGRLRGLAHQVLLGTGELWAVLEQMLRDNDVDLVVAGTHGRTGIRKLLLGSVAEEIFRLADCPVLTVGPKVAARRNGAVAAGASIKHILLATDFSPSSVRAAAYAFSLAQENQAQLTLLHVIREAPEQSPQNRVRVLDFFHRRLGELIPPEADLWCKPEFVLEHGEPAEAILRRAGGEPGHAPPDLIILGVRKSANFPGHLPPATAYRVVCQAPCPVLTVRG